MLEALAAYAHGSWSGWMQYMFKNSGHEQDGTVTIPAELVERWERQMNTPYEELPESEKASDLAEAANIQQVVRQARGGLDMSAATIAIFDQYYGTLKLKWPTTMQAVMFAITELGEVLEVLLAQEGGWTRNHPENKPKGTVEELGEELGDMIMMAQVAGIRAGVDPLAILEEKCNKKMCRAQGGDD